MWLLSQTLISSHQQWPKGDSEDAIVDTKIISNPRFQHQFLPDQTDKPDLFPQIFFVFQEIQFPPCSRCSNSLADLGLSDQPAMRGKSHKILNRNKTSRKMRGTECFRVTEGPLNCPILARTRLIDFHKGAEHHLCRFAMPERRSTSPDLAQSH